MNTRLQEYPVSYKKQHANFFKRVVHIRFAKVNPAR